MLEDDVPVTANGLACRQAEGTGEHSPVHPLPNLAVKSRPPRLNLESAPRVVMCGTDGERQGPIYEKG